MTVEESMRTEITVLRGVLGIAEAEIATLRAEKGGLESTIEGLRHDMENAERRGYRAGIEAAVKAIERQEWVEPTIQAAYARVVRALAAPAAPKEER